MLEYASIFWISRVLNITVIETEAYSEHCQIFKMERFAKKQ